MLLLIRDDCHGRAVKLLKPVQNAATSVSKSQTAAPPSQAVRRYWAKKVRSRPWVVRGSMGDRFLHDGRMVGGDDCDSEDAG